MPLYNPAVSPTALTSGQVITWNSDTGISRDSTAGAANFDFGNGSANDKSGTLNFAVANIGTGGILSSAASARLQLGAADAASPVAQTLSVQSVVAGTSNTAGTNWTLKGSAGTGTGTGGQILFQVAPAGSTGTAQNAFSTAMTLGVVVAGGSATSTQINGAYLAVEGDFALSANNRAIWISQNGQYALRFPTTGHVAWSNNSTSGAQTLDTDISRIGAAIVGVGNGTTGDHSAQLYAGTLRTNQTTVSGLPSASTAGAGARAFVTDANATTFDSIVAGSGSNGVPVFSDGTNWRIG